MANVDNRIFAVEATLRESHLAGNPILATANRKGSWRCGSVATMTLVAPKKTRARARGVEILSGWLAFGQFHDFTISRGGRAGVWLGVSVSRDETGSAFLRVQETGKVKSRRSESLGGDTRGILRWSAGCTRSRRRGLVRHASSMCSVLFSQRSGARKLAFPSETRARKVNPVSRSMPIARKSLDILIAGAKPGGNSTARFSLRGNFYATPRLSLVVGREFKFVLILSPLSTYPRVDINIHILLIVTIRNIQLDHIYIVRPRLSRGRKAPVFFCSSSSRRAFEDTRHVTVNNA